MIKKTIILVMLVILGLTGCQSLKSNDSNSPQNTLNWSGVYTGTIPAADTAGIRVTLTLRADQTYNLRYEYIGAAASNFTVSGKFVWDRSGSIITLDAGNGAPPYYKAGENILIQLDMRKREITGSLAQNYILRK